MNIGELDMRVIIQYPENSTNSYGESVKSGWSDYRTVWAKAEWKGGSEGDDSDKITATTNVVFYIRNLDLSDFLDGVNAPTMAHRISFNPQTVTKYYYLQAIEQIEGRERFVKIITKEKD
ncbi:MAG: head-tail adaptor protein [Flavobacteriales bacterium]|nr:head-tail adaptor protein [Flavobacteriales bacterium]